MSNPSTYAISQHRISFLIHPHAVAEGPARPSASRPAEEAAARHPPRPCRAAAGAGDRTDGELLDDVRAGCADAYGILFGRHRTAALRVARRIAPDSAVADDAVSDAFAAVLSAIRGGSGPVGTFVPYLVSSVSHAVYRILRQRQREKASSDSGVLEGRTEDPHALLEHPGAPAARKAYKTLPQRWREVIFYLDFEQMKPSQAAPKLGLSPNATVALHRRAKEGLRLAYLHQHLEGADSTPGEPECQTKAKDIPAYVIGSLRLAKRTALESHLEDCSRCTATVAQAERAGVHRRAMAAGQQPSLSPGSAASAPQLPAAPGLGEPFTADGLPALAVSDDRDAAL